MISITNLPDHGIYCYTMDIMYPAIFLDRDGVIIENQKNYVRSWKDVEFIPSALGALAMLRNSTYRIILVTNQSVVGRGIITLDQAQEINQRLDTIVTKADGRIDAIYMCPHSPDDKCDCRKPHPGLLLQAAKDLELDLSRSFIVGDALSDLMAGRAAGIRESILVLTGRGKNQITMPETRQLEPFPKFASLLEAVEYILFHSGEIC